MWELLVLGELCGNKKRNCLDKQRPRLNSREPNSIFKTMAFDNLYVLPLTFNKAALAVIYSFCILYLNIFSGDKSCVLHR